MRLSVAALRLLSATVLPDSVRREFSGFARASIARPQQAIRNSILLLAATFLFACANDGNPAKPAVGNSPSPTAGQGDKTDGEKKTTSFDGDRAFNHVKAQVELGSRPAGSPAIEKTREYIIRELKSSGLTTTLEEFTTKTPRGNVKFKNVIAELPGESPDVIIIASHYDTKLFKEFAFVGANDGGSSTGALLEIARVMAAESQNKKRKFTYWFVFFDGEEAFCREWSECLNGNDHTYGSRYMVERLKKEKRLSILKTMILLDMIGDKDLTIPRDESSSQWLVDAIWGTARQLGYSKEFPGRASSIGDDDHMPFLREGVPAVDIIDFEYGSAPEENDYWHTQDDTLDKISARSLKIVGDVLLLSLPKIEAQIR